ncbi:MAG: hypothetical protein J5929_02840 [Eubacterium sp.]|nr:hypothetical protein [Eubacterium sp.]
MGRMEVGLSKGLIDDYISKFDKKEKNVEEALKTLIENYPKNTDINEVMIKVAAIDSMYSTQLNRKIARDKISHVTVMSERIKELKQIDKCLHSDNKTTRMKAVQGIAIGNKEGYDDAWSFASKYCSWHNQSGFAIFDKYSRGTIYSVCKTKTNALDSIRVTYELLLNYETFYDICEHLIAVIKERYNKEYTFKQIDKFLWQYGYDHPNIAIS